MSPLAVVVLLVAAAAVAGLSARRGVAAPLALTAVGIAASFVPGVPVPALTPELALEGFLPPLLYAAAIRTPFVAFRRNLRPILLLSVGLVLATAFAVGGVVLLLLPGVPVAAAIALGAVVAPPDAVAATAVARRVGMPRHIVTILEGESLLNDATALVVFNTALGVLAGAGAVTLLGTTGDFAYAVAVGVGVGLAIAVAVSFVRPRISDPVVDTSLSLLVPFAAFLLAEQLHASGVLAVVVAGLVLGHRAPEIQSAQSRATERTLWRTVVFLLESVVFLLIGLQLRQLLVDANISAPANTDIALLCAGVVATVVLVRVLWVFPTTYLFRLAPGVRAAEDPPPWQHVSLVAWAGMRGVVTMAVAFALAEPEEEAAARVLGEYGPALVIAAFSVVVATLLVQGSTLPWLVRRLRVRGPDPAEDALQQALVLQHAVDAGRRRLEELAPGAPRDVVANLDLWSERLAHASWERLGGAQGETSTAAFRRLRLEMLAAERAVVVEAHRSGRVPGDVLEGALERLDLEEAMIADLVQEDAPSGDGDGQQLVAGSDGACEHLRSEPLDVAPRTTDECPDCLELGERSWVHLRMCVRCGHVGCCDSSPRRHADAHFRRSEHPVMRSVEVGEGWRWCFLDRVTG